MSTYRIVYFQFTIIFACYSAHLLPPNLHALLTVPVKVFLVPFPFSSADKVRLPASPKADKAQTTVPENPSFPVP